MIDDVMVKWKQRGEGSCLVSKKRDARAKGQTKYVLPKGYI